MNKILDAIEEKFAGRLQGKVAIITGAGSGMGKEMVDLFSSHGAKIVAAEWHKDSLENITEEIIFKGGGIIGVEGNVSLESDCDKIVDAAIERFGRVDILCNNAGVMDINQGVGELDNAIWDRVIGINLNGPVFLSRRVVPLMVAQGGGSIINIVSMAGISGGAAGVAYTASKHALIGVTKNTAYIYGQDGVRCNAIAAGAVQTNIMQSVDPTKMDQKGSTRFATKYASIPAQLQAKDIAELALFLASDESKMINGAIIPADAGWSAA